MNAALVESWELSRHGKQPRTVKHHLDEVWRFASWLAAHDRPASSPGDLIAVERKGVEAWLMAEGVRGERLPRASRPCSHPAHARHGAACLRPEDDLLTTAQVAQMLHVSPQTVGRLVKSGSLPAHRIPGTRQLLFWRHQIAELVNANRVLPDDADVIDAVEDARPIKGGGR